MAAIVWADVVGLVPDMASANVTAQALLLDVANTIFNAALFPGGENSPRLKLARVLLVAHMFAAPGGALGGSTGEGLAAGSVGPVTSESGGGLSTSYASLAANANGGGTRWASTSWGRMLDDLLRGIRYGMLVA